MSRVEQDGNGPSIPFYYVDTEKVMSLEKKLIWYKELIL